MDTKSLIQIPGYRYNEYLVLLSPHEELQNKILQVKKEFGDKYNTTFLKYSKPNIGLVNFIQFEMMEERIVNRLKTIALGYTPFKVDIKGFGSFPSHTLFINVESKQQVYYLVKELKTAQRIMALNKEIKPHFMDDPYIPIARKLSPWQYEKGWQEYSHKHFTGRFLADGMLLIKRKVGEKAWQIVQRFDFMNLPVTTKQGNLFLP